MLDRDSGWTLASVRAHHDRRSRRRGFGLLAAVLLLVAALGVMVGAYHFMWRGSSRTLFYVQEHRQLLNLGRSALAEAYFDLQSHLNAHGGDELFDWFTRNSVPAPRSFPPARSQEGARFMTSIPGEDQGDALRFELTDVEIARRQGFDPGLPPGVSMGVVDLSVVVQVERVRPHHAARIRMCERRNFEILPRLSPLGIQVGTRIHLLETPVGTWVDDQVP